MTMSHTTWEFVFKETTSFVRCLKFCYMKTYEEPDLAHRIEIFWLKKERSTMVGGHSPTKRLTPYERNRWWRLETMPRHGAALLTTCKIAARE